MTRVPFVGYGPEADLAYCGTLIDSQWGVRSHWGLFGVEWTVHGVTVYWLDRSPRGWSDTVSFPTRYRSRKDYERRCGVASKWIKAAVVKRVKAKATALPAEVSLCTDRPALTDFLTELEGPNGGVREPSALMVVLTETGVRVGLKDEDAGGWCWREAPTLQQGLDAIEKALQAGEGAFRAPRSKPGSRKGR